MSWTSPFTAVTATVIQSSDWNTSGRDNLNYLFNVLNKNAQQVLQQWQASNTFPGDGLETWDVAKAHYAAVMADGLGGARLGNDAGKYVAIDNLGNITRQDGAKIFPVDYQNGNLGSNIPGIGPGAGTDVKTFTVVNGGIYKAEATVIAQNHSGSVNNWSMTLSIRDAISGGGISFITLSGPAASTQANQVAIIPPFVFTADTTTVSFWALINTGIADILQQGTVDGLATYYTICFLERVG